MAAAARAGVSGARRFTLRLLGLLLIGVAHATLVFFGDILVLYALLGLPLLALRGASPRALACVAAAAMVVGFGALSVLAILLAEPSSLGLSAAVGPGYLGGFADAVRQRLADWRVAFGFLWLFNGPVAFAAFCLGLAAAKIDVFRPGNPAYSVLRRNLPLLLTVGLLLNLGYALSLQGTLGQDLLAVVAFASLALGGPILASAYLVLAVEAARRGWLQGATAAAGRMSLTGYVLEGMLAGLVFNGYGLGLYGTVGAAGCLLIALGIVAATHLFAMLWLRFAASGPLEIVLRGITRLGEARSTNWKNG
ncbi:MAG: DUF418 domain-containing protein [Bosea sp. (in: a-proteobacteria)]|uniref:DUF418 domain-containing protein n=1 Tax=Bosea sp. (in: a-proteobacteria) TaxID=1871050 RepID=UPI00273386B8|nr:DUF418 domain-containing protein [Bosea sp. (in: a-proteobacteria)]MDP3602079.1 DUF418 domain-containing protein [Bosea sp. (in: a-proteobacteria)]